MKMSLTRIALAAALLAPLAAVADDGYKTEPTPTAKAQPAPAAKTQPAPGAKVSAAAQADAAVASPRKFVEKVGAGGLLEVELGKLAAQKGRSAQVQEFGRMMAADHAKAIEKLGQTVRATGIQPPAALPAEKQAEVDRLSALSGAAFDREYMKKMVEAHRSNVDLFREAARSTALGGDLRRFATETLPTIQSHLEKAEQISAAIG